MTEVDRPRHGASEQSVAATLRAPDDRPDPGFPRLHGRPARGWLNDPNGLSRVDGRYHVFFQHNPDGPRHGSIKWGHVSSTDLVRWRAEPVALVNRPGAPDEHGCWSGCVVDDGGVPTAVYSGVTDDNGRSEVLLATSDRRMRQWTQERTPVLGMPDDPAVSDMRDPFLFEFEGHRFALLGAGHRDGDPQVLLYGCDDLHRWTELGPFLTLRDPVAATLPPANIWECPNLALIDDRWVLIVSLWRQVAGVTILDEVYYLVGDLSMGDRGPVFRPQSSGELDTGPCFYAPQILLDPPRTLLWAWAPELWRTEDQVDEAGWAGCLTFPRQLSVVDDALVSEPAAELRALRGDPLPIEPGEPFEAAAFELEFPPSGTHMSLWLLDGEGETLALEWTPRLGPVTQPRLLVDGSMIELFDGGPASRTTRAYPGPRGGWWRLRTAAGPTGAELRAWRLR